MGRKSASVVGPRILKQLLPPPPPTKMTTEHNNQTPNLPPRLLKLRRQSVGKRFVPPRLLKQQRRRGEEEEEEEEEEEQKLLRRKTKLEMPDYYQYQMNFFGQYHSPAGLVLYYSRLVPQEPQKVVHDEIESTVVDYARLTSFLENNHQHSSFLTPWNWNRNNNADSNSIQPYFSFNVREKWSQ